MQIFFLSCHYTFLIHWKTHSYAASLYSIKSSVVHSWGRIGHFSRWSIVCVCSPQSHMVSASLYFHFSMFDLQRPIPVLSLFRHFHHGPRSSDDMDVSFRSTDRRWWDHALSRSAGEFVSSGVTKCTRMEFPQFQKSRKCVHFYNCVCTFTKSACTLGLLKPKSNVQ